MEFEMKTQIQPRKRVKDYLSGNLCRCTGYVKIVEAVLAVKDKMKVRS